ncbi:hypothetical protein BKA66DRAFT_448350 [Pyrenochaeta sp. MPI-SDFR-AT-0127]|nr:hypothetical protein BKA66DRAFT_448350 [Pyrenochaeta sp. MPI-SDFR-AT-0127]
MDPTIELTSVATGAPSLPPELPRLSSSTYGGGVEWERIPWEDDNYFLQVFDVSWSEDAESNILLDIDGSTRPAQSLEAALQALPEQEVERFRFYVGENFENMEDFRQFLIQFPSDPSANKSHAHTGSPSFARLRSQWNLEPGLKAWSSKSYDMLPIDPHDMFYQEGFFSRLIRFSKLVHVAKDAHGRVSVFITCTSEYAMLRKLFKYDSRYESNLSRPTQTDVCSRLSRFGASLRCTLASRPLKIMMKGNSSQHTLIQAALLVICQCILGEISSLIETTHDYAMCQENVIDPRLVPLTKYSLEKRLRDAYFYEQLQDCVSDLVSATEPLLELLSMEFAATLEYKHLTTELHILCTDLSKRTPWLSHRLGSHLHMFDQSRSLDESLNVGLLSLLASIFLPLSLAASLLSMQTRFTDLQFILYDFGGISIFLGTVVIIVVHVLHIYARIVDGITEQKYLPGHHDQELTIFRMSFKIPFYIVWLALFIAFFIGMVADVALGLNILKYVLVFVAISLWATPIVGIIFHYLKHSISARERCLTSRSGVRSPATN